MTTQPELALIYDFDGTLCDGNMADHHLLGELGCKDVGEFWAHSNETAAKHKADRVCTYMQLLIELAGDKGLSHELLQQCGAKLPMREGLTGANNWFDRVDNYCKAAGFNARHYVISSGLAEMIESSPISGRLAKVYGSRYFYNNNDAVAPAWTVNYTTKTQFLFRINKGLHDLANEKEPNMYMDKVDRPVPFANMIFIGDGYTDIPCFSLVRQQGGYAIALLQANIAKHETSSINQIQDLVNDDRVDAFSLHDHFVADGTLEKLLHKVVTRKRDSAVSQDR